VNGHPKDVYLAGADLDDEEDVEPAQRDGVEVKKSVASSPVA
jgi:hypothetical protein